MPTWSPPGRKRPKRRKCRAEGDSLFSASSADPASHSRTPAEKLSDGCVTKSERDAVHLPHARAGLAAWQRDDNEDRPRWGLAGSCPGLDQPAAVLACVKTASRRLRRWPAASLDPGCARRPRDRRPGRRNAARPNRETPPGRARRKSSTSTSDWRSKGLRSPEWSLHGRKRPRKRRKCRAERDSLFSASSVLRQIRPS
jgi:hypothetical protein